jgi:hypothetical protein
LNFAKVTEHWLYTQWIIVELVQLTNFGYISSWHDLYAYNWVSKSALNKIS